MNTAHLQLPKRIWIEVHDPLELDSCDVIVEMENGMVFTAVFVTLPYLSRQMDLSYAVAKTLPDTPPVRYAALETPHIIVGNLNRDTIEDTIDNLLALDMFYTLFTQVTEDESEQPEIGVPSAASGQRATAEVAAVVLNEVLRVEGEPLVPAAASTHHPPTGSTVA
jgi:hypothetical protein